MTTGLVAFLLFCFSPAMAYALGEVSEITYIFNTLLFLMCGFLVMFMAAGFAMLEAGLVRSVSVATILTKNIALYAIAGLVFYLVGYNLMYSGVDGGFAGTLGVWLADDSAALQQKDFSAGYAAGADWFFQMVFVATAASIVSGTVAERLRLWPFLLFVTVLTGIIYPIAGAWHWGGGWLADYGFKDFAGSTIVHSVGGWAALAGAIIVGPRYGRFSKSGKPVMMPGSSLPLAALGTFILWLGWFGFNGGSQLAFGSAADAVAVSNIFINTNAAAAAGVVSAMLASQMLYKKVDPTMAMNGALGGLVSITAEPLTPLVGQAALIGLLGGIIVTIIVPLLYRFKIDDVVGAIPVHLCCGIWGTLAVPLTNPEATLYGQAIGIAAVGVFVTAASTAVWLFLKATGKLRLLPEEEFMGADLAELGMEAYPDFVRVSR